MKWKLRDEMKQNTMPRNVQNDRVIDRVESSDSQSTSNSTEVPRELKIANELLKEHLKDFKQVNSWNDIPGSSMDQKETYLLEMIERHDLMQHYLDAYDKSKIQKLHGKSRWTKYQEKKR